jgi:Trypsin-like peptidase domain/Effector-associated domain 1
MMPGVNFGEFQEALVQAFDRDDLEQMVRIRLNEDLDAIVGAGTKKIVAFRLLTWAERRGLVVNLARAVYLERPRNENIQRIYEKFGMAPAVSVQAAGAAVAGAPARATATALEATVRPKLNQVDLGKWREKLAQVEGQVCRIEFNGNAKGTGFLVGPDLVLTNYHVLERPIKGQLPPAQVACRFDYKVLSDDSRSEGVVVRLHQENWSVDHSPYSKAEADDQPDRELPTVDELDYALVRLATMVGSEPVEKHAAQGAPPRGWIEIPEVQPALEKDMPLLIAQHPDGSPMKLALDTQSVIGINENGTRVRYATNTEHGSSGSPCFNMDWSLVALHHMGDPAWKQPKYNEGIPMGRIRERLAGKVEIQAP